MLGCDKKIPGNTGLVFTAIDRMNFRVIADLWGIVDLQAPRKIGVDSDFKAFLLFSLRSLPNPDKGKPQDVVRDLIQCLGVPGTPQQVFQVPFAQN